MIRAIWGSSRSTVEFLEWAFSLALMEGWLKQPTVIRKCTCGRVGTCDMMARMELRTLGNDLTSKPTYLHPGTRRVGALPLKGHGGVRPQLGWYCSNCGLLWNTSLQVQKPILYSLTFPILFDKSHHSLKVNTLFEKPKSLELSQMKMMSNWKHRDANNGWSHSLEGVLQVTSPGCDREDCHCHKAGTAVTPPKVMILWRVTFNSVLEFWKVLFEKYAELYSTTY